jgi:hypothetical protein
MKLALLRTSRDALRERLATRRAGWSGYLAEAGHRSRLAEPHDSERLVDHLLREQDALLGLAAQSALPVVEIDGGASDAGAVFVALLAALGLSPGSA